MNKINIDNLIKEELRKQKNKLGKEIFK